MKKTKLARSYRGGNYGGRIEGWDESGGVGLMIREKVSRSRDTGEGAAGTAKAQREKKDSHRAHRDHRVFTNN